MTKIFGNFRHCDTVTEGVTTSSRLCKISKHLLQARKNLDREIRARVGRRHQGHELVGRRQQTRRPMFLYVADECWDAKNIVECCEDIEIFPNGKSYQHFYPIDCWVSFCE
jgi:hypothetical protein